MPLYPMKFAFSTENNNDRVEAVVMMPREKRSVLHGTVYDTEGNRMPDAVLCLYRSEEGHMQPVADTFTDADGEFVFGPLEEDKNYVVKAYANGALLRQVTIKPRRKRSQG